MVELRRYPWRCVNDSIPPHSILLRYLLGVAQDWQDNGACVAAKASQFIKPHYESKSVPLELPVKTPEAFGRPF